MKKAPTILYELSSKIPQIGQIRWGTPIHRVSRVVDRHLAVQVYLDARGLTLSKKRYEL